MVGVAALARISGAKRVILALPAGVAALGASSALAKQYEWETATVNARPATPFANDYLMVLSLTGREVPTPYGEPRDVGVIVEPLEHRPGCGPGADQRPAGDRAGLQP